MRVRTGVYYWLRQVRPAHHIFMLRQRDYVASRLDSLETHFLAAFGVRLGRLTTLNLPRGPVGPVSRWATASNVEGDQTTYPVNRGRVWTVGRDKRIGMGEGHQGSLAREGGLY